MIFSEGDPSAAVYAVISGRVRIEVNTPAGGRLVIAVKEPGEIFGEFGALDGGPRSATASSVDGVGLVQVTADDFLDIVTRDAELAIALLRTLSTQLRQAVARTALRNSADTTTRLAWRLTELADRFGEFNPTGVEIDLAITQDDLAGWIGATREATARSLRQLRDAGCVVTARRRIVVADLDRLRRLGT